MSYILEIIKSERGRDLIVFQNYTFYTDKHINNCVKWCGTHRGCLSSFQPIKLKIYTLKTIIFVDGTFLHCSKFFLSNVHHVYTYTVHNNYYIPLIQSWIDH